MHGIVIAAYPLREYDRRVLLLSPEGGVREYQVRSVRKGTSKNNPALQPGNSVICQTAAGKQGDYITSAQLRVAFPIHQSFAMNKALMGVLRIVEKVATNEPSLALFEHLDRTLQIVAATQDIAIIDQFLWWFLSHAGFIIVPEEGDHVINVAAGTGLLVEHKQESNLYLSDDIIAALHTYLDQSSDQWHIHPVFYESVIHELLYWTVRCHIDTHMQDWHLTS